MENLISDEEISNAIQSNGFIGLVEIKDAEKKAEGTRSEQIFLRGKILKTFYGKLSGDAEFWRYSKEQFFQKGKMYVIAATGSGDERDIKTASGIIAGFAEVPAGKEAETASDYQAKIARLKS